MWTIVAEHKHCTVWQGRVDNRDVWTVLRSSADGERPTPTSESPLYWSRIVAKRWAQWYEESPGR